MLEKSCSFYILFVPRWVPPQNPAKPEGQLINDDLFPSLRVRTLDLPVDC